MKHLLVCLGFAALVPSAAQAAGEEFTFVVPYQIDSIPGDIKKARILCALLDERRTQVAQGLHNFDVSVGPKLKATIKVKMPAGKSARPVSYACYLEPPFGKKFNEDSTSKLVVEGPLLR